MIIYIVVVCDRHADDELLPYLDRGKALARAKEETDQSREYYKYSPPAVEDDEGLTPGMLEADWIYYSLNNSEGDSVRVEQRETQDST